MSIYKIGVEIALINNISRGVALIAREFLGLQGSVGKLEGALASFKTAAVGALGVFTGTEMLKGISNLADMSKELIHQQELMRVQGWTSSQMMAASNAAWRMSGAIPVTVASENLKHLRELAYATGSMDEAIRILPNVTQANTVLNAMKGGGTDEVWNLVKALEEKGLTAPGKEDEFLSYVDAMTKAVGASGGRVTLRQFQSAFLYGRTARLGWDEEFITQILPRLIQSMSTGGVGSGTGGPGNALMSAWKKNPSPPAG